MSKKITYILSIAGHDPTGGAGVLADIKVFDHLQLMGFGAVSGITYQSEKEFLGVTWLSFEQILRQIQPLDDYKIKVIKIGLIENWSILNELLDKLRDMFPEVKIIWDPIVRASAGFKFHFEMDNELLDEIMEKIYLVTPNIEEAKLMGTSSLLVNVKKMSEKAYVFLKGGHHADHSNDELYYHDKLIRKYQQGKIYGVEKHGSGCVLSSAIASNIALNKDLEIACRDAKEYTLDFLISNETLLGQHQNPLIA